MVVIPTIIDSNKKVEEMFKKLEVYYLANKSDNLYFTLLGDCKPSKIEKRKGDKEIVLAGIHCTNELNKKYYVGEDKDSNPNATTSSELAFKDLTLIKIKNGKIVKYLETLDTIKTELGI